MIFPHCLALHIQTISQNHTILFLPEENHIKLIIEDINQMKFNKNFLN